MRCSVPSPLPSLCSVSSIVEEGTVHNTELEVGHWLLPAVRPQATGHWPLAAHSLKRCLGWASLGASAPKRHLLRSRASPKRARLPAGDLLIAGPGLFVRHIATCCMPGGAPPAQPGGGKGSSGGMPWDALGGS